MATTTNPSPEEYPFQVGRMVYRTQEEAEAAIVRAKEIYPNANPQVVDRRQI